MDILSKGLTFIPNFNCANYHGPLLKDIQEFHRRLLLRAYFKDETIGEPRLFVNNGSWTPCRDFLDIKVNSVFQDIYATLSHSPPFLISYNTTPQGKATITSLRPNRSIIINKADKGNNIVHSKHIRLHNRNILSAA